MQNKHGLQQLAGNFTYNRFLNWPSCSDVTVEIAVLMDVHGDEEGLVEFPPTVKADEEGGELVDISSCWMK